MITSVVGMKERTTSVCGIKEMITSVVGMKERATSVCGIKERITFVVGMKERTTSVSGIKENVGCRRMFWNVGKDNLYDKHEGKDNLCV